MYLYFKESHFWLLFVADKSVLSLNDKGQITASLQSLNSLSSMSSSRLKE